VEERVLDVQLMTVEEHPW